MKSELEANFSKELIEPTLDIAQDYAEMGLDYLLSSDIAKEVPIVKTAFAFFKTGVAIRDRYFVKKLLVFLKEFHSNLSDSDETEAFRKRIDNDPAFRNRVTEHLLVIIDKLLDAEKAQILARLFRAHVHRHLTWDQFVDLSIVLDSLRRESQTFLKEIAGTSFWGYHGPDRPGEASLFAAGIATRHGTKFAVTEQGQLLYTYGLL
ncbi:hypothetical protein [Terriglobus sp. ADX1]|uniref:hypothetical protein n=1 Tax=Terriglobus sp. ADX1 TaxID=2794063 RepID=UPI002FE553F4